jgi:hypothetical protein
LIADSFIGLPFAESLGDCDFEHAITGADQRMVEPASGLYRELFSLWRPGRLSVARSRASTPA